MAAVAKVLVQQTHLDIFSVQRRTDIDIKGWIANQNYYIDERISSNSFKLRAADSDYLKSALANDCNRMAAAAIETISGVDLERKLKKSGAWGLIRTYYATFFAIHSIMRMFGTSCSQLDQNHMKKVFESASAVNLIDDKHKLESGFYSIKISKDFRYVHFEKYKDSHKDTWKEFLLLINSLIAGTSNAAALSEYKLQTVDLLTAIKQGITRTNWKEAGNWMSSMRNSVNYQLSHGAWYPYAGKPITPSCISKFSTEWIRAASEHTQTLSTNDVKSFFEVALLINSLFRELLIHCFERANCRSPIFRNGSLRLLKELKAADVTP